MNRIYYWIQCIKKSIKFNPKTIEKENIQAFSEINEVEIYKKRKPTPYEKIIFKKLNGRILDIGCGAGKISVYLAEKGLDVEGFDASEEMIKEAEKLAKKENVEEKTRFYIQDLLDLDDKNKFDYVLCLFNQLTYFPYAKTRIKVIKKMISSLKKNGEIIITTTNKNYPRIFIKCLVFYFFMKIFGKKAEFGGMFTLPKNAITPIYQHMFNKKEFEKYLKKIENIEYKFYTSSEITGKKRLFDPNLIIFIKKQRIKN